MGDLSGVAALGPVMGILHRLRVERDGPIGQKPARNARGQQRQEGENGDHRNILRQQDRENGAPPLGSHQPLFR